MRIHPAILLAIAIFAVVLAAGCTGSDSTPSETTIPTPQATTEVVQQTEITPEATLTAQADSPKYNAGMIVTDNKGDLKLITVYDSNTEKYTTRTLLKGNKGNQNEAYVLKDGSFKEMGISFNNYKSFESKYPYLYDDLNENSDTGLYYNYDLKEGNRIYIYTTGDIPKYIGYLTSGSPDSMEFVNTNA